MIAVKKILIIRGWNSKKKHWEGVKKILEEKGFEVLIPDLPGITYEGRDENFNDIEDYEKLILRETESRGWDKFSLICHSLGGTVGAKFSAQYPEKIDKLILFAPALFGTKSPKKIFFYFLGQVLSIFFSIGPLKKYWKKVKKKLINFGFKDYYLERGNKEKSLRKLVSKKYDKYLKRIKTKTLILWGKKDKDVSSRYAKKIKKLVANSRLKIFKNFGHNFHRDYPETFAKEVINFII